MGGGAVGQWGDGAVRSGWPPQNIGARFDHSIKAAESENEKPSECLNLEIQSMLKI